MVDLNRLNILLDLKSDVRINHVPKFLWGNSDKLCSEIYLRPFNPP